MTKFNQSTYNKYSQIIGKNIMSVRLANIQLEIALTGTLKTKSNSLTNYCLINRYEFWSDRNSVAEYITLFAIADRFEEDN